MPSWCSDNVFLTPRRHCPWHAMSHLERLLLPVTFSWPQVRSFSLVQGIHAVTGTGAFSSSAYLKTTLPSFAVTSSWPLCLRSPPAWGGLARSALCGPAWAPARLSAVQDQAWHSAQCLSRTAGSPSHSAPTTPPSAPVLSASAPLRQRVPAESLRASQASHHHFFNFGPPGQAPSPLLFALPALCHRTFVQSSVSCSRHWTTSPAWEKSTFCCVCLWISGTEPKGLAHGRYSINVCWMKTQTNLITRRAHITRDHTVPWQGSLDFANKHLVQNVARQVWLSSLTDR